MIFVDITDSLQIIKFSCDFTQNAIPCSRTQIELNSLKTYKILIEKNSLLVMLIKSENNGFRFRA